MFHIEKRTTKIIQNYLENEKHNNAGEYFNFYLADENKTKQNKTKQNNPVITDLAEIFEEMVLIGFYTIH